MGGSPATMAANLSPTGKSIRLYRLMRAKDVSLKQRERQGP